MKKKIDTTFLESVISDNESLYIISFSEDSVLATDKVTGKAYFFYEVSREDGLSFCFNMLSEVGAMWQTWFIDTINDLHYKLESVETETDIYDTLTLNK